MRFLITGGSGLIGSRLVNLLSRRHDVHFSFLSHPSFQNECESYKLDITQRESTITLITKLKPDIIIHTSALTNVDLCETNRQLADLINVQGTKNVVDGCMKIDRKIIYISTSNVFDGKKTVFLEDDKPNTINHYGFTKLAGERIVTNSNLPFLILRTDHPYSWAEKWQRKSFVNWITKKLEEKKTIEVFSDWYNNPTFLDDFIDITAELIKREKNGIYHVVGPNYISRYKWALYIAKMIGVDPDLISPAKSNQSELPARRANANLNNSKVQKETGKRLLGVNEGVKLMQKLLTNPKS